MARKPLPEPTFRMKRALAITAGATAIIAMAGLVALATWLVYSTIVVPTLPGQAAFQAAAI